MKTIYTHVWIALSKDGWMSSDEKHTLVGADLWICVLEPNGVGGLLKPWVYDGHYLDGVWYHSSHSKIIGQITHYMIRDFKPEPPDCLKY